MKNVMSVKPLGIQRKLQMVLKLLIEKKGSSILYLCKSCTKLFDDPLCNTDKKALEQQVVGLECSNASYIQPSQQSGGSLDD
jgi:hypothetical protein